LGRGASGPTIEIAREHRLQKKIDVWIDDAFARQARIQTPFQLNKKN
jgi:hypothetical protein